MVLTRRGAKAIAAASAPPPSSPSPADDDDSASVSADIDLDPRPRTPKEEACDRRSSIAWRLWIGHTLALLSVSALVHAGRQPPDRPLPLHAVTLLLCAVPLRTVLAFSVHALRAPALRPGMFLALSAAVLFASNALHVLATRALPAHLLALIAAAAVDVCAAWLRMTVSAKQPSLEPFALPRSLVYSAADVYLAAAVARQSAFADRFFWFLPLRFLFNLVVVVNCSVAIVAFDEAKKKGQVPSSRPR